MFTTRALAGLAAAAATVALPLATTAAPADAAPVKHHVIKLQGKEPTPNHFKLIGAITPMYHLKRVQVLRQPGCKGKFSIAEVVKTDKNGIFRAPIYIAKGTRQTCWTARTPASTGYAPSASKDVIRVYKI